MKIMDAEGRVICEFELAPINMLLFCPACGEQHIDMPDLVEGWDNPPHKTHRCEHCRHLWRPCDLPTNGVDTIRSWAKYAAQPALRLDDRFDKVLRRLPDGATVQYVRADKR